MSFAIASSALVSMSQTNTLAPVAANARANSRPMPAAPAVIKTRCGIVASSPDASSALRLHESALDDRDMPRLAVIEQHPVARDQHGAELTRGRGNDTVGRVARRLAGQVG